MRNLKLAFLICICTSTIAPCYAQKYLTASGVRIGSDHLGVSLQQRFFKRLTVESIISMNVDEARLTGLVEHHQKILGRRLNVYLGLGGHISGVNNLGTQYGIDGILGLEYKMMLSRLNLSFDFQPSYLLNADDSFNMRSAITLRKVLLKDNHFKKKKRKRQRLKKKKQRNKD